MYEYVLETLFLMLMAYVLLHIGTLLFTPKKKRNIQTKPVRKKRKSTHVPPPHQSQQPLQLTQSELNYIIQQRRMNK